MDELNHRLYITHYFKTKIFEKIKADGIRPFLTHLNKAPDTIATVYGTYSYLELLKSNGVVLADKSSCTIADIKINTETLEPDIKVEQTMKDLNILILMKDDDIYTAIYESSMKFLKELQEFLKTPEAEFPYTTVIKITNTKKVFTGTTISLLITTPPILRGVTPIPMVTNESFITIDIYKCVNPEAFEKFIDFEQPLPTLTKCGYKILNSFVYNAIVMGDIPVNKVRDKVIMSLFATQEEAIDCVEKCKELFPNKTTHSIIFRQFLDFFNVPILSVNGVELKSQLNFAQLRSVFNSRVLELKNGQKPNLREVINSFLNLIDIKLVENNYGRFVKAGGEAFRHYKDIPDFLVVNDIDARIVLNNPSNSLIQIVYQNIIVCLYFLVRWVNNIGIIEWDELNYTFEFAGKEYTYKVEEVTRKDFPLALSCRGSPYTFLSCTIQTFIEGIDVKHIKIVLNPLDISIEEQSFEKKGIEIIDGIIPPVVNESYFIKDLSELLSAIDLPHKKRGDDPLRTLRRWYKGKLNKDIERYNLLKRLIPKQALVLELRGEKEEDPKHQKVENVSWFKFIQKTLYSTYRKIFPIEESLVNNTDTGIILVEQKNLDKTLFFDKTLLDIFYLVWDPKFNEKYVAYLKQNEFDLIVNKSVLFGSFNSRRQCTCREKYDVRTSECPFTFLQYLMCKFTDQTKEEICLMYTYINNQNLFKDDSDFFINILAIVTKLKEMDYSDDTIIIKTIDPVDDDPVDVPVGNDICTFVESFKSYDFCFLEWYISNTDQYKKLNEKLRNNIPLSFVEEIIFFELDRILRKGVIAQGTILYKGVDNPIDMSKSQSFFSTTANKYIAMEFAKHDPEKLYTIKVLSDNISGIYLPLLCLNIKEDECLFPPNVNFVKEGELYNLTSQSSTLKGIPMENFNCKKKEEEEEDELMEEAVDDSYIEELDVVPDKLEQKEYSSAVMDVVAIAAPKTAYEDLVDIKTCMSAMIFLKQNLGLYKKKDIDPIILKLNEREFTNKQYKFDQKYERRFGDLMMEYSKHFLGLTDIEQNLNAYLTLEKKYDTTSIRQLLNQFIATTNRQLVLKKYGQLVKKGGETLRYYTQEFGENLTNDIDSEFCFESASTPEEQIKVLQLFLPKVLKSMIVLTKIIKKIDFKVDFDLVNEQGQIIGKISSYEEDRSLVPEYISVRTNYVGNCFPDKAGSKKSSDCLVIVSIDINFRIVLLGDDNPPIVFYKKTAPYDFLISKKKCEKENINDRGGIGGLFTSNNLPPIVSLYAELINLRKLLTDDVEKRKKTGKHQKDLKRCKALLRKIYSLNILSINKILAKYKGVPLEKLHPLLLELSNYIKAGEGTPLDIPLDEKQSDILDQLPCNNVFCNILKQEIDLIWATNADSKINHFLDIPKTNWLNSNVEKLNKILDLVPGQVRNTFA